MYERSILRNLEWDEGFSEDSLFRDLLFFCLGFDFADCLFWFLRLINPVINSHSTLCIFFYFIGNCKAWQLVFSKYVVKGRCTDAQFLCYATLFLVVVFHPFCEFIHLLTFFYFFFWTKIRNPDTLSSIPAKLV